MLDELAPQVVIAGHRLPCAALRALALRPPGPRAWQSTLAKNALLLAASQVRFAQLLAAHLPSPDSLPAGVHVDVRPQGVVIPLGDIGWEELPAGYAPEAGLIVAGPDLAAYLQVLPESFIRQCLGWAPPIVMDPARDERRRIVANVLPALMAWHHSPDMEVVAMRSVGEVPPVRSLVEIVRAVLHHFEPLVTEHAEEIARFAPSLDLASQLSGLSRAGCAERRKPAPWRGRNRRARAPGAGEAAPAEGNGNGPAD
ncbi:hypothetical protein [Solimonas sp. SE-A11]|uniref:hypothetical protein n=1 Tax=Solimonas sp. SE-A11 TaxID=3054954 RepID=UPI00259CD424|nr:hypothetical protein [Solimonas sp. SE-A11]MDM4770217.1 hypothetical protein [Solimonas sp. SE-A11]